MKIPVLWYENAAGERWVPPERSLVEPPPGYRYQHSRFPCQLTHTVLNGSDVLMRGTQTYSPDLVLALCRPTTLERLRQILRYGVPWPRGTFEEAVILATSCERCMNSWAHRAGLTWGYRERSSEWSKAGTSCEGCMPRKVATNGQ